MSDSVDIKLDDDEESIAYYHPEINPPPVKRGQPVRLSQIIGGSTFVLLQLAALWIYALDLDWPTFALQSQYFVAGALQVAGFFQLAIAAEH